MAVPVTPPPSIMVIAGEDSADQYAGRLIRSLKQFNPELRFFGIGGDRMHAEGAELLFRTEETSIMGFWEVITHLGLVRRMFNACEQELLARKPQAVILIDYPGFNLRFAKKVKAAGIPVIYYIAPQVWAWGKHRTKKMKPLVDEMAVVFPFEEEVFHREGIQATFVGHPLLEILEHSDRQTFLKQHSLPDKPILALLPGSRKQEIHRMLPVMLEAAKILKKEFDIECAIGASSLPDDIYRPYLAEHPEVRLLRNSTHALMEHAHAAIVTSGTATVETALYGTPMVVGYKTSPMNYIIARWLIQVDYISMVNILSKREVVKELIQHELTPESIVGQIRPFFADPEAHARMRKDLNQLYTLLGSGKATERVAGIVQSYLP